jgi:hydroxymethylpyrimidine pyrophosphatase-like HAD family hydrolase
MLGIDVSEIAAIGDSENDREMLEAAGYAISVSEGRLEDVSDYVTKTSFGEGCVEAVEHLIKEKKLDI